VVEVITERGVSGRAAGVSMSAVDGSAGTASPQRSSQLAAMVSSFLQRQRGGGGPVTLRAPRRLGPGRYTTGLQHVGDAATTFSSAAVEPVSLYRLRLARSQPQPHPQRLFLAGRAVGDGAALEAADSFDVDVDIELLPVGSAFLASVGGDAWLQGAATGTLATLRCAAREVAGLHAAARSWTCAHRRLLLALLAAQLALTALLALVARACPEAAAKRRTKVAMRCSVIDAADEVRAQLAQPLLQADADVDAANPMHGMLVTVNHA